MNYPKFYGFCIGLPAFFLSTCPPIQVLAEFDGSSSGVKVVEILPEKLQAQREKAAQQKCLGDLSNLDNHPT